MHCKDLNQCYEQIRLYVDREGTGYPLVVNVENFQDFYEIRQRMSADDSKQCVYVSDHTFENGLPNIPETLELIKNKASYVVFGISQSVMLRGEEALDEQIDTLIGYSIQGHAIILLSHCRINLEKYLQRDPRLSRRIILVEGERSPLPQLCLVKTKEECLGAYVVGIKNLLSRLERITDKEIDSHPIIYVVTNFTTSIFRGSLYSIALSDGVFQAVAKRFRDLAISAQKGYGTDDEWAWLLGESQNYGSFSELIVSSFGSTHNLAAQLENVLEEDNENRKWLLWVALKVFGADKNSYLALALSHSEEYIDFPHHLYQDFLDISYDDEQFDILYKERKQLLSRIPENLPEINTYCVNVGRHGKNGVYYLTDATEDEEYAFMQIINHYEWSDDELIYVIKKIFPELSLYLEPFVFDVLNTKLSENDTEFRKTLTDYFHRYKIQKIRNHIDDDFLVTVNQFAMDRPFLKLQARSSIASTMNKNGVQAYFFDALGVEYLSYIQAKCEEYGLVYDIRIGRCELPSITVKNKEFTQWFKTRNISDLDELKHHSQTYDYQTCEYPIHIFRELNIIDRELRNIRSQLIQKRIDRAVIFSDHGASRLAVIFKHEDTSLITLDEKGQHSGRCCPCEEDPNIPQAIYEDGYAVLANYERFKGGRKANLEVHGGASLEEVVVPVITISLKPTNVEYFFVNDVIKYKVGKPTIIILFSNIPMRQPRLEIEGTFYDGVFETDKNHATFTLTEQKRTRTYQATVYEGNTNTGTVLSFRLERNTKTKDLFGL